MFGLHGEKMTRSVVVIPTRFVRIAYNLPVKSTGIKRPRKTSRCHHTLLSPPAKRTEILVEMKFVSWRLNKISSVIHIQLFFPFHSNRLFCSSFSPWLWPHPNVALRALRLPRPNAVLKLHLKPSVQGSKLRRENPSPLFHQTAK